MSSDALRNAWIASGDPQITWRASLGEGDRRAWLRAVLRAGREHAIYTVHEAPAAGYLRERDGELEDARPDDLFAFAASGTRPIGGRRLRVSARLAYVEDGRVVEDDVEDLGALLARLRPDDVLSA